MTPADMRVGWTGKLPCRGDFIEGGVPLALSGWFADWASRGAATVRAGGGPAADAFLTAPLVRFAAAPGALGGPAAIGVLGPGMDRSGRLYPFLIAAEPDGPGAAKLSLAANAHWFDAAEAAFLDFLAPDFDAAEIGPRLEALPAPRGVPDDPGTAKIAWRAGQGLTEVADLVPGMVRMMGLSSATAAAAVPDGQAV